MQDFIESCGLKLIDLAMIFGYFGTTMAIGFWAARRVKNNEDYFLGGRSFGKGLLVMHWLCTGTHSEMAVQVVGASARVGLGGIWYQWMWLFSTPFYWMIAPVTRRLRVVTTGDFFRIRYGRSLEMLYTLVGIVFHIQGMAMLLRGAGAAISGATGGRVPTEQSIVALSILFATYVTAGGLVAAAYTDVLQGLMIIVLSVLLVPIGLNLVGGMEAVHQKLGEGMLSITAPPGAAEGDPLSVVALSLLGLVSIVVQPHVMTATGSGKTELEARVGMCYGNFIKRLLTIAWAFTGLIAVLQFPEVLQVPADDVKHASETLFGHCIQNFLSDGWRGLMIACLIAGVTSAETLMVVGAGLFTRNFYMHIARDRSDHHYLWVGRCASATMLSVSILLAFHAKSVTDILMLAFEWIGLLGAAFWLGVTWRRANAAGVWASFLGTLLLWFVMSVKPSSFASSPALQGWMTQFLASTRLDEVQQWSKPLQILVKLACEFGLLIFFSRVTRPRPQLTLDAFFARLHTPVGKEPDVSWDSPPADLPESATLGLDGQLLDYEKSSRYAYPSLQRLGIELPRLTFLDWAGFLAAWLLVFGLIGLLYGVSRIGAPG